MAGRAFGIQMGVDVGGGSLIGPDGVAPIWMVGVSASVIFPCTTEFRFLLAPAHPDSPGKRPVRRLCVFSDPGRAIGPVCVFLCLSICVSRQ